jgi:hypothetical protein
MVSRTLRILTLILFVTTVDPGCGFLARLSAPAGSP